MVESEVCPSVKTPDYTFSAYGELKAGRLFWGRKMANEGIYRVWIGYGDGMERVSRWYSDGINTLSKSLYVES